MKCTNMESMRNCCLHEDSYCDSRSEPDNERRPAVEVCRAFLRSHWENHVVVVVNMVSTLPVRRQSGGICMGPDWTALTNEQLAKAKEWVEQKITNTTCPLCDADLFGIGEHLVDLPLYVKGRPSFGQKVATYPQFQLLCMNCGYT